MPTILIVSPSGESLLLDTGFPDGDRDAERIYAAAQRAGLKQIDYGDQPLASRP